MKKLNNKIVVELVMEETDKIVGGFRQDWISGQDDEGNEVELLSGAGLSNPYLYFNYTPKGKDKRRFVCNMATILEKIAEKIKEPGGKP